MSKIHDNVLVLLKIGAFLIFFSDSYPAYAVVNEVVSSVGGKVRGFVNGMLRSLLRKEKELRHLLDTVDDAAVRFNMPTVVMDNVRLISDSDSELESVLEYLNREPLFHLRVNTRDYDFTGTQQLLIDEGIGFRPLKAFDSFEVKEAGAVVNKLLDGNRCYFQNSASQLIVRLAAAYATRGLLDCCAAPGTKSLTLALSKPDVKIIANDIHPGRAAMIQDLIKTYHLEEQVTVTVSDAADFSFSDSVADAVDVVLVDAPCSSSGTLRKNPDLKLSLTPDLIARNAGTQFKIMHSLLCAKLKPGTIILYSVCSFMKEETEGVMKRLLQDLPPGVELEAVDVIENVKNDGFLYKKSELGVYLLPSEPLNNDLFYLSAWRLR